MNKKQIHSNVLALPNKHKFSVKNVLEWIKTQQVVAKQCRNGAKRFTGAKSLQSRGKALNAEAYVKLMRKYLRTGLWINGSLGKLRSAEFENQWCPGECFEAPDPRSAIQEER